ncbi:hypothetical protein HUT06_27620 [Actinomadura sp. NAK00032]|uniref:hypothetical protein n=1 Tax=Actinomadura sp. NAK00032 TaxID=2742128 RepID=UPI001591A355|nr:hypothetical protein [Actinomadura sp. NAK00032]QKW37315.1 hypothetical protein HUT06_27620 [Actinomadura sp. NAK00032]
MGWWRRLRLSGTARAAGNGDSAAIDELWWTWFFHPDPWLLRLLTKLGVPPTEKQWHGFAHGMGRVVLGQADDTEPDIRAALLEALGFYNDSSLKRLGDHPMKMIARDRVLAGGDRELMCDAAMRDAAVARHCLDRGLEPADPARRAAFRLLAGEHARFAELDPDGTRLAAAHAHLDDRLRVRVNEALLDSGRLAFLAPERVPRSQAAKLVDALAARGEWSHLCRMLDALPLAAAVKAAAAVPEPAGRGGGPLFDLLAGQDPAVLDGLVRLTGGTLRSPGYDEQSTWFTGLGAISPDGRRLVAWCEDLYRTRGGPSELVSYALLKGEVSDHRSGTTPPGYVIGGGGTLLDTGEAICYKEPARGGLYRLDDRGWNELHRSSGPIMGHGAGFVTVDSARLRLHDAHGDVVAHHSLPFGADWTPLAGDPISGRMAWYGESGRGGHLMVTDPDGAPVARSDELPSHVVLAVFRDADQVIGVGEDGLRVWHVEGRLLRRAFHHPMAYPGALIMLRPRDEVVIGRRLVDAGALVSDLARPAQAGRSFGRVLGWHSDCGLVAVAGDPGDDDELNLVSGHSDAIMETATRRLTAMTRDDLATVRHELTSTPPYASTRPFLDLLHAAISLRLDGAGQT